MPGTDDLRRLLADEHHLVVVNVATRDGRVLSSVVNAGLMPHPTGGHEVAAFVSRGDAARLGPIRRDAPVTVTVRRGWRWAGAVGAAELIGPDDPAPGFDAERVRQLLRDVFVAAGGSHDDWDEYDRVMRDERRVAVFVELDRIVGNA